MKIIKSLTFAALAVTLLFQTPITQAGDRGKPVAPSNPFVILLDGTYAPAEDAPDLGLSGVDLNDGSFYTVPIYNLDSGVPGPSDKAAGTFYVQFAPVEVEGELITLCAYDLPKGALKAKFVDEHVEVTPEEDGSWTLTGTYELEILEATGIYRSFAGGRIHMVDVLHFDFTSGTFIEHCFCHISREHGKP